MARRVGLGLLQERHGVVHLGQLVRQPVRGRLLVGPRAYLVLERRQVLQQLAPVLQPGSLD